MNRIEILATSRHTPLPYRIGDAGHTIFGPKSDRLSPLTVASVRHPADARFILEAVNNYEAICAERDRLRSSLRDMLNNFAGNDNETPFIVTARAALANK